jgi:hypothetical protein
MSSNFFGSEKRRAAELLINLFLYPHPGVGRFHEAFKLFREMDISSGLSYEEQNIEAAK